MYYLLRHAEIMVGYSKNKKFIYYIKTSFYYINVISSRGFVYIKWTFIKKIKRVVTTCCEFTIS